MDDSFAQDEPRPAPDTQRERTSVMRWLLLQLGYYTVAELAVLRGEDEAVTAAWLGDQRAQRRIFLIGAEPRTVVPAVLLDADGGTDERVCSLVRHLLTADLSSWEIWNWLCTPTGLLSGDIPAESVRLDPARAERAARLYAEALREQTDTVGE